MSKYKRLTLKDVEVAYPVVLNPVNKFESDDKEWLIKVKLSDEQVNKLSSLGCKKQVKEGNWMKFQKDCQSSKGNDLPAPDVVDLYGEEFTEEIGNGSICNVRLLLIPYEKFGGGTSFKLDGVQVKKHVPYVREKNLEGFELYEKEEEDVSQDDLGEI